MHHSAAKVKKKESLQTQQKKKKNQKKETQLITMEKWNKTAKRLLLFKCETKKSRLINLKLIFVMQTITRNKINSCIRGKWCKSSKHLYGNASDFERRYMRVVSYKYVWAGDVNH